MARIRSIKPEFPQSETIGKLSRDARLLFILLWTIVDDSGKSRGSSRMLASVLFPYDDDARELIDGWLSELETNSCIRLYEVDGSTYLEICNWLKHQKIDHPSPSRLPEFREASRILAKPSRSLAPDLGSRTKDLGSGPRKERGLASLACSKQVRANENFERFYSEYPKKVNRRAAVKKFKTVVKSGVDPEKIIAAARKSASAHRMAMTEQRFIPAPDVWLNKGCYDDVDMPQPRAGPASGQSNGTTALMKNFLGINIEEEFENAKRAAAKTREADGETSSCKDISLVAGEWKRD